MAWRNFWKKWEHLKFFGHRMVQARVVLDTAATERLDAFALWWRNHRCTWMTSLDVLVAVTSLTESLAADRAGVWFFAGMDALKEKPDRIQRIHFNAAQSNSPCDSSKHRLGRSVSCTLHTRNDVRRDESSGAGSKLSQSGSVSRTLCIWKRINFKIQTEGRQRHLQIRALAGVTLAHVIVQIRSDSEFSSAALDSACKRFHALVEAQVLPQMRRLSVRLPADLAEVQSRASRSLMTATALTHWVLGLSDSFRSFRWNVGLRFLDVLLLEVVDQRRRCRERFGNALMASKLEFVGLVVDEGKIVVFLESAGEGLVKTS